ncbi:hypothetical protein SRABI70_03234 [Pseudomonas sp. Bi70]|nr:hypothetical protein SRABI70_03234 [Pseudomonas sp. Bi70]
MPSFNNVSETLEKALELNQKPWSGVRLKPAILG